MDLLLTALFLAGKKFIDQGKFARAMDAYSKAIDLAPSAILFANRAFCHTKLENFGSAIVDATEAIKLDPRYPKVEAQLSTVLSSVQGYFRRGTAYVCMLKFKDAVKDFKHVSAGMLPTFALTSHIAAAKIDTQRQIGRCKSPGVREAAVPTGVCKSHREVTADR